MQPLLTKPRPERKTRKYLFRHGRKVLLETSAINPNHYKRSLKINWISHRRKIRQHPKIDLGPHV